VRRSSFCGRRKPGPASTASGSQATTAGSPERLTTESLVGKLDSPPTATGGGPESWICNYQSGLRPAFGTSDIDAEVVFDRYLGAAGDLDTLQSFLSAHARAWSRRLRIWITPRDQRPIDIEKAGSLRLAIVTTANERGPLYAELVRRQGRGRYERQSGSVELRGSSSALTIVVSIDEMAISRFGSRTQLGNQIALQIRDAEVEGRPGSGWLREGFERLAGSMSPAWGEAGHPDEYWAKVMTTSPRIEAGGRDFGRFLPGIFWLNFLGRPYVNLIGRDRLRSARAQQIADVDDGVLIQVAPEPFDWRSDGYRTKEAAIRAHLGPEFFFDREARERPTAAPDWGV
jgi:hypothetical protein